MARGTTIFASLGLAAAASYLGGLAFTALPAGRFGAPAAAKAPLQSQQSQSSNTCGGWAALCVVTAAAACGVRSSPARTKVSRQAASQDPEAGRRAVLLPAAAAAVTTLLPTEEASAELDPSEIPERINADPYDLIGMENPDDIKIDKKEFYMKKDYRADTYQVLKHMKISGSLDKGTPRMERWNKRIKEEMDDWVALYRRQEAVVGRQSYYTLYSAVNTLASHFTSYGPKFPFPNKRRPRFYELIQTTEKYLEKNK